MGRTRLKVVLLSHTPEPQELIAVGAKLCYSAAGIDELRRGVAGGDQQLFLNKLMEYGHLSPIEHASFTFGVEGVSRSLLAQITRHRIASFSVKSQRYVAEAGEAGADGVFGFIVPPAVEDLGPEYVGLFAGQMKQIQEWYDFWREKLGDGKQANEDARFVLPNAVETKMVVTMNARQLLHFFALRTCFRAQWEIRALAGEMLRLARGVAPVIFREGGPACLRGPCPESKMSCGRSTREVREQLGL